MSDIIKIINDVLPIQGTTYNEGKNMLVTQGYTSYAGNTYFNGIRLSNRIFIVFDIGIGWLHTFLNGVRVFTNNNGERKIIGSKSHHNQQYNEDIIKNDAVAIIKEKLINEAITENIQYDEIELNQFIQNLVDEAYKNQIETLKNIHLGKLLIK